jgi:hypothetical protein
MDKLSIKLSKEPYVSFVWGESGVVVKPYMNMSDKMLILKAYFDPANVSEDKIGEYISCEYGTMLAVLDTLTNFNIQDIDIDNIVDSGLWDKVKSNIKNIGELYSDIEKIKKNLQEEKSLEGKLNSIVDKASVLLAKASNLDLSEQGIQQLLGKFDEVKKDISAYYPNVSTSSTLETPVVNNVVVEPPKAKKPRKSSKTTL